MKKLLLAVAISLIAMSAALAQDAREPRMEITGVNPTSLPTVSVLVNIFDSGGQPVPDLNVENFSVVGELADRARIVDVESFSDQDVPIAVVLVVDVSSSMAGTPIQSAQAAASAFIDAIAPEDPVAIVTFSSGIRLIQDFTTDRPTLMRIINALGYGGQTYLFDGVLAAVEKAAEIDNPRRAIIVLSDGAQYDTAGLSKYTSDDVLQQATINGIPIYTIGLGFGVDRHYLQNLSTNTNALFRESPTPAELEAIYAELADLLRTQYELVLEVDVPPDGTTYNLEIEADTPDGIARASGLLRAPVPVPVIRLPELTAPIASVTDVEASIVADDGLASVEASLDGAPGVALEAEPYSFTIDPVALAPGAHRLTFTATDADGDTGTASLDFEVAALPSQVTIVPALGGEIADVQTFALEISGQTPAVSAQFQLDDSALVELTDSFSFTIDPFNLPSGDHSATVTVVNAGGETTTLEAAFSVPELPIQFAIEGLAPGQLVEESITVNVEIESSQAAGVEVAFEVNGEPVAGENGSLTLNPVDLPPGPATLSITVTNEAGQTTTSSLNFEVAALPPQVTIIGLEPGETLEEDRLVIVETTGQTALADLSFELDGQSLEADASTTILRVLEIEPGTHVLAVTAQNQGGQSTRVEMEFTVSEGPSLTATARSMPTAIATLTSTGTSTLEPTETLTETVDEEATTQAQVVEITATADTEATEVALSVAQSTATAEAAASATEVEPDVSATATTGAEMQATVTEATVEEPDADATATAEAQATADLLATANALATENAHATETQTAADEATATAEAEVAALAAADEQATADAQATLDAEATATAEAEVAALAAADEQATADAQATVDAEATTTAGAEAQPTETVEATEEVTEATDVTPTEEGTAVAQAATEVSATPTTGDEASPAASVTPIGTLVPAQAESTPSNEAITPIVIIVVIAVIVLLLVYFFLSRARRQQP